MNAKELLKSEIDRLGESIKESQENERKYQHSFSVSSFYRGEIVAKCSELTFLSQLLAQMMLDDIWDSFGLKKKEEKNCPKHWKNAKRKKKCRHSQVAKQTRRNTQGIVRMVEGLGDE